MRRIPELDGLRGIAILMVLVHHTEFALVHAPWLAHRLWLGVDLFFVLSGFLITEILLRRPTGRGFVRNFYVRRALRIWPAYYLLLLVVWLFGAPLFGEALRWGPLFYHLSFTQCVPFAPGYLAYHPALRSTWSLAVEEQFYLVWPPLTLWLRRQALAVLLAAIVLVAIIARAEGGWLHQLVTRGDALALGSLLALYLTGTAPGAARRLRTVAALAGTGGLAVAGALAFHLVRRLALVRTLTAGASAAGHPVVRRALLQPGLGQPARCLLLPDGRRLARAPALAAARPSRSDQLRGLPLSPSDLPDRGTDGRAGRVFEPLGHPRPVRGLVPRRRGIVAPDRAAAAPVQGPVPHHGRAAAGESDSPHVK